MISCLVCMRACVHVCVAMREKVGNSWECECWKEEIVRIHVDDCVQLSLVCLASIYVSVTVF